MSQISVTAAEGRRVPLPGGKVVMPGDKIMVEENDMLIYRLLDHGDLVRVKDTAAAPEADVVTATAASTGKVADATAALPAPPGKAAAAATTTTTTTQEG